MDVRVGLWRRVSAEELILLKCGVEEDSWESLGFQRDPTSPFWRRSALGFLWREWCYSWNSSTLATSCKELTHWKRLWCWEGLRAGGKGDDRGWDGWMASPTWWTRVWVNSGSWWWTGRPGVLRFMGSQRVGHNWATELNWTELRIKIQAFLSAKVSSKNKQKSQIKWGKTVNLKLIFILSNKTELRTNILIILTNVNGFNLAVSWTRHWSWLAKQNPSLCWVEKTLPNQMVLGGSQ